MKIFRCNIQYEESHHTPTFFLNNNFKVGHSVCYLLAFSIYSACIENNKALRNVKDDKK